MATDWKQMSKGFLNTINEFADIQQQKSDIKTQQMKLDVNRWENEEKAKQNFFWKMQEKNYQTDYQKNLMKMFEQQGGVGGTTPTEENLSQPVFSMQSRPQIEMGTTGYQVHTPTLTNKDWIRRLQWKQEEAQKRGKDPFTYFNPTEKRWWDKEMASGGKTLISPMITKISQNEDAYYNLGSAVEGLKTNADKFSQFMGPGKSVLRNPLRSYVNKDLQDFLAWKANVQDAFQSYRVAVTGAQASDKEIALLAKNRPTENDTYDVFVKKTEAVRKVGNQVIKRYITNLGKAGYNVSGYQDTLKSLDEEMGNLGNNQTSVISPEGQGQRIKIKSPNGQVGSIPAEQLQDALTQGYQEVQ